MSSTDILIKQFLLKLNNENVKETFEILSIIVEQLENKSDPKLFEIHLFNAASDMIEKINLIHDILKEHRIGIYTGDNLQRLYDKQESQVIFD